MTYGGALRECPLVACLHLSCFITGVWRCLEQDIGNMKARHFVFAREILSPQRNMLQMKICKEDMFLKVVSLPLFGGCAPNEIKSILEDVQGKLCRFDAKEVILHECMPALSMVVVVSGVVFVHECGLAEDSRHLVQRLYEGGTFGATFPAIVPKTYPGMLVAEVPSVVLFLNVVAVRRMMGKGMYPRFLSNLYAAACMQGYYAWRKLMLLSCYEVGDRVILYLKWRAEDGLPASVKFKYGELAEYLGVNRTALYRAIAKLRKAGKISVAADTLALA